jgi:hypothetical protein
MGNPDLDELVATLRFPIGPDSQQTRVPVQLEMEKAFSR